MYRFIAILSLFSFFACKNSGQKATTPAATVKTETPKATPQPAKQNTGLGNEAAVTPIDLSGVPPASASKKAYFTTKYWACFGAQHPTNDMISAQYLNVKLQFFEDMTFKMFRNKEYVFSGKWGYDDANSELFLSSTDKYYNSSFKTKDVGMRMIWIGNTDLNKMGVQMRWDNHQNLED